KLPDSIIGKIERKAQLKIWDKPEKISQDKLNSWLENAEGLISRGDIYVDNELINQSPKLRVIAQSSVGYDNINIEDCTKHSIPFGNTPEVLNNATADLIFGLLLSSARKIHEGYELIKNGNWKSSFDVPLGVDLFQKTLGIVGMG